MTLNEARKKALHPAAFADRDTWMVKDSATGTPVEGASSWSAAEEAVNILNEHETRNGRIAVYVVEPLEPE